MKIAAMLVLTCCLMFALACPSNTPYGQAASAGLTITDTIHAGADAADQLRIAGTITKAEEKQALTYLEALNDLDAAYGACIEGAHKALAKADGYLICAESFKTTASDPSFLASFHIVNATSQQTAQNVTQAVFNILDGVINVLKKQ